MALIVGDTEPGNWEDLDQTVAAIQAAFGKQDGINQQGLLTAVPAGAIFLWGSDTPPTGYLICNGDAKSRSTYSAIFDVIGTTYGVGDGSTTFNLPDLRQRFPLGKAAAGTGATLGGTGGAIDHTHSVPGLSVPALSADPPDTDLAFTAVTLDANLDGATASAVKTISVVPHTDIASFNTGTGTTGTDTTGTGNPPFQVVHYVIKT